MNKLSTLAAVSFALVAFTTQAFALNPQPEPPGKNRVFHISTATGARFGSAADADDSYCGTKVPGHVPYGAGGISTGGRVADYDDNYCGTRVPGHIGPVGQSNATLNGRSNVMLNPQPLPPRILQGQTGYRQ